MTTPNSDGTPTSPGSVDSPNSIAIIPESVDSSVEALSEAEVERYESKLLESFGLNRKTANQILAGKKSAGYLNTKIIANVSLVNQCNSAELVLMAQKKAGALGRDKTVDPKTRAACFGVVMQGGVALARLSEASMSTVRGLEATQEEEKPKVNATQNNFFGFPPVATDSREIESEAARIDSPKQNIPQA